MQKGLGDQEDWQASGVFMLNWRGKTRKLSKHLVYKLQNTLFKLLLNELIYSSGFNLCVVQT